MLSRSCHLKCENIYNIPLTHYHEHPHPRQIKTKPNLHLYVNAAVHNDDVCKHNLNNIYMHVTFYLILDIKITKNKLKDRSC